MFLKNKLLKLILTHQYPNLENNILYHIRGLKKIAMLYVSKSKVTLLQARLWPRGG